MLEIKSLKKNFVSKNKQGKNIEKTAVKDLNLTIDEGEIFGLLGPNGAYFCHVVYSYGYMNH